MFVLIDNAMSTHNSTPTRIASYVVSGVGFLGAGVIISDGVSIRGINTGRDAVVRGGAGALAGSGYVWQAGVATAAVLAINLLLRPLGRRIDRQPMDEDSEVETTYRFHATTPTWSRSAPSWSPSTETTSRSRPRPAGSGSSRA